MKHKLTNKERAHIVKLLNLGISAQETSEIVGVSVSTVFYTRQAYEACIAKDYATITRLYQSIRATMEWALNFTNTEYSSETPLTEEESAASIVEESNDDVPAASFDNKEADLYKALADICDVLNEIRDLLK